MSIRLTRYVSPDYLSAVGKLCRPLRIVAEALNGEDPYIFVYHLGGQPLDPTQGDQFECVASPSQLIEIPVGKPIILDANQQIPYYRDCELRFLCRDDQQVEYIWQQVQLYVTWLMQELATRASLISDQTAIIDASGVVTSNPGTSTSTTTTSTTTPMPPNAIVGEGGDGEIGGEGGGTIVLE